LTTTQDDDGTLTEAAGQSDPRPRITSYQQHLFTPAMQSSFRLDHRTPAQAPAQSLLHAAVPAIRHAA
jgi:hypothetical protein